MAPTSVNAPAYKNPAFALTPDHSAPTTTLEIKSPIPFTVANTPNPDPRDFAGNNSAASDFSTDACTAPWIPASPNNIASIVIVGGSKINPVNVIVASKYPAPSNPRFPTRSASAPAGYEAAAFTKL